MYRRVKIKQDNINIELEVDYIRALPMRSPTLNDPGDPPEPPECTLLVVTVLGIRFTQRQLHKIDSEWIEQLENVALQTIEESKDEDDNDIG